MKKNYAGCSRTTTLAQNDSTPIKAILTKGCTFVLTALMLLLWSSCNDHTDDNDRDGTGTKTKTGSIYVLNEGNYMAGNATLTVYNPESKEVEADIFSKANGGAALGDTPTSMTIIGGKGFITISGSGKIYIINPETGVLTGKITGLNSPRHIIQVSETKAYVSNLWNDVIDIINPITEKKVGEIELDSKNYAEMFVKHGDYIYTNLWSYGNKILKIDPKTDKVIGSLEVGTQPTALFKDKHDRLWTLTDGGYQGITGVEFEEPTIVCINTKTFTVEKRIQLPRGKAIMYSIAMDPDGENVYYVDLNLYKMSVDANALPTSEFISYKESDGKVHNYYRIGVDPESGDIYLADAIDFMQAGSVLRYNKKGEKTDAFKAGIIPGGFCFIPQD